MPASFPPHAAAVLPVKMRWPHAFDGVALVIASSAPDQGYAAYGWRNLSATHQWPALLWFVLPMTIVEAWLCRRAAPIVATHLAGLRRVPILGRLADLLAIGDYGAITTRRHRWYVTVYSALFGGLTHLVWDGLVHRPGAPGWANNLMPFLNSPALANLWWWRYGESISSVVGGALAIWMFARIGRRRLVRQWDGPAPVAVHAPVLFWTIVGLVAAGYAVVWPGSRYLSTLPVQGVRALWVLCIGLLLATAAVALRSLALRWLASRAPARRALGGDPLSGQLADSTGTADAKR